MDPSGAGDISAVKRVRANPPSSDDSGSANTEVDGLSPLPNDILADILSAVDSTPDAVRTSLLSQRWRSLWKLLPELHLAYFPEQASKFGAALHGHEVPLRDLHVEASGGQGALPKYLATWLPAAAGRVSGSFVLWNGAAIVMDGDDKRDEEAAAPIELPCFERAASISICLGLLGSLAMPPPADAGGVFSNLTDLCLERVWFRHPSELGDAVSSARCPCLETLKISHTPGLEVLAIRSTSLLEMTLVHAIDLQELSVEAPELQELTVVSCFVYLRRPAESIAVTIAAPELELLEWRDWIESQRHILAQLSQLPLLRELGDLLLFAYGTDDDADFGAYNRDFLEALKGIQFLENLTLILYWAMWRT